MRSSQIDFWWNNDSAVNQFLQATCGHDAKPYKVLLPHHLRALMCVCVVCWMVLHTFSSMWKAVYTKYTKKLTEWLNLDVCCNKDAWAQRLLCTKCQWQTACWNLATPVWYSLIRELMLMKPITVTCFYHNSCCLLYVRSLERLYFSKTVPQCARHGSFQTGIFHKVV